MNGDYVHLSNYDHTTIVDSIHSKSLIYVSNTNIYAPTIACLSMLFTLGLFLDKMNTHFWT